MNQRFSAAIGLCALSIGAVAGTTVNVEVSTDGVDFSNHLPYLPNVGMRTVEVRASVSTDNPVALGLSSIVMQPTISGWAATDALVPLTASYGSNTTTRWASSRTRPASTGVSRPGR
jgi:hypothetical protein